MTITKLNKLWKKVCAGDSKSFEALYHSCAESLYFYGLKFTHKSELIEDAIQDLFLYVFNNSKKLDKNANGHMYLLRSFRNNLLRLLEREKRYNTRKDNEFAFDVTFSIERKIMASEEELERKKWLLTAIERLSARQKEMIYLRFTRGLEYGEIGDIMGMEVFSVRNAMCRTLKTLRKHEKSKSLILCNFFQKIGD